jgi:hypothetical protein
MNSGFCNASLKHMFSGVPDPLLIIHEIFHAVFTYGHGTRWQNRMLQAAETASRYDPGLFGKNQGSGWDVSKKFSITRKKKQSLCIYGSRILFIILILKGKETITVIDDSRVLKELLPEMEYRKEWDDKKYGKMVKRGKEIADTIKNFFHLTQSYQR